MDPHKRYAKFLDVPCWDVCEMCEGAMCSLHAIHVEDCACQPLEWWVKRDMNPYDTTVREYLARGFEPWNETKHSHKKSGSA